MSISNDINKKALFLLKNFGELNNQFIVEDLQSPLESLVRKTSQLFEQSIVQKCAVQKWELISATLPSFRDYSLEDIFCAAIQAAPNSSVEDTQQIFTCLKENQGMGLYQIYVEHYSAQFLTWAQDKACTLPPCSSLLVLKIWQNFGSQSMEEAWKAFLSLPGWESFHKQALDVFKSKHDFMIKNHAALQQMKFKGIALVPEVPESIKNIPKLPLNQYVLWTKALNDLLKDVAESYQFDVLGFNKSTWEYQLLYAPKEISFKILIWRAKKISYAYQSKLQLFMSFFDEKISNFKEEQKKAEEKISQLLFVLEKNKQGFPIYTTPNIAEIKQASEKDVKNNKENQPIAKEELDFYLKEWEKTAESIQIHLNESIRFKDSLFYLECLRKQLMDSLTVKESEQEIAQDQVALIEKNQRELIQAEDEFISSQKKPKKNPDAELLEIEGIEPLSSSDDESNEAVAFPAPALPKLSFVEIDAFLKDKGLVNGSLSKSIDGVLKELKGHLLTMQPIIPDELKALRKEKIHEIPTQLTMATAALELMIQAIEDQRFDHMVLGFRSGLIHCHFAIEQMLSLRVLLESHESTNSHDLIELAKKAKINTLEEKREFLKEIGVHLWFCYPKDYPFFYPEKSTQPKTFLFLQRLFSPYDITRKKLDVAMLKEAVQLFFTMYSKTIEFIIEIASAPKKNLDELLHKIKEIQNQIQIKRKANQRFIQKEGDVLNKCSQALTVLHEIDQLDNIKNFEKRLLLPLNTMKEYLELMKRSLEIPEKSHAHCLQEFIQLETLANMDKLFKDLFRTIILLQTEENNYTHNLSTLFQLAKGFYEKDLLTEMDEQLLKEINISITHHYLHKSSYASLKKDYKDLFDLAEKLNMLSEKDFMLVSKKRSISYETLRRKKEEVFKKLDSAFDLFIKLLKPVVMEMKQLNEISLIAFKK